MQAFSTSTASLPKELATTGALQLKRKDALTLTGRFFKLRMDVNLSSGILGEEYAGRAVVFRHMTHPCLL